MYRRVIIWLLAIFVVTQGAVFLNPQPARATGTGIFEQYGAKVEVSRTSKDAVRIISQVKVSEDGTPDETFATFIVTQNLKLDHTKGGYDYWKIASVSMSDLAVFPGYGAANSKLISPTKLELRNKANEPVGNTLDFSSLPNDSPVSNPAPCYEVYTGETVDLLLHGTMLPQTVSGGKCTEEEAGGRFSASDQTPISAITYQILPGGDHGAAVVGNYDAPSDTGGKYSKTTVTGWLGTENIRKLKIEFFNDKMNNPPKIIINKIDLGNRPPADLTFKLVTPDGVSLPGGLATRSVDWVTYQGYVGTEKVDNLYFRHNDGDSHWIVGASRGIDANFYWTDNYADLRDGVKSDDFEIARAETGDGTTIEHSILKFFSYVMNVPIDDKGDLGPSENCGDGTNIAGIGLVGKAKVKVTGPKNGKDVQPTPDQEKVTEFPGTDEDTGRLLNSNCMNFQKNGWLYFWGITNPLIANPGTNPPCSIGDIFSDLDVGEIFKKLTECMFEKIFRPMVEWATSLVIKAAGITYNYRPETWDRWRV